MTEHVESHSEREAEYLVARLRLGEEDRADEKNSGCDLRREEHTSGK